MARSLTTPPSLKISSSSRKNRVFNSARFSHVAPAGERFCHEQAPPVLPLSYEFPKWPEGEGEDFSVVQRKVGDMVAILGRQIHPLGNPSVCFSS